MLSRKSPTPSLHPAPKPAHSCFLGLAFPSTGGYCLPKTKHLSSKWWPIRPSSATYADRDTSSEVLVSSYCSSSYRVADPFSSLGTFSSSSIGGPVFHPRRWDLAGRSASLGNRPWNFWLGFTSCLCLLVVPQHHTKVCCLVCVAAAITRLTLSEIYQLKCNLLSQSASCQVLGSRNEKTINTSSSKEFPSS
jgi:hypothetical protein